MLQLWWALLKRIIVLLLGLMINVCHAQEKPLELAYLDRAPEPKTTRREEPPVRSSPRIDVSKTSIDDALKLSPFQNLKCPNVDYWTEYANQPSERVLYEYCGLQKVIYNQIEKFANRYYSQQLRTYWDQTYLHPMDLDRAMRRYALEAGNQRRWWDRPWYDSLPEEKGGERTVTRRIGERTEIFKWRSLSLTNEGKFSWDVWRFDVEDNPDVKLSDLDALQQGEVLNKYNFGIQTPEAHHSDSRFDVSWGVKANLRVDDFSLENRSQIGLSCKMALLNNKGAPYLRLQFVAQVQPFTGEASIRGQLSLLEF